MTNADFDFLTRFLHERSGIALSADKAYLVESRLLPLVRTHKFKDLTDLIGRLRFGADAVLADEVVDAMTTNETFFFRDKLPFDRFRDIMLPQLIKARAAERRLRIWCAACSTGQEPYSLAMLLQERRAELSGWKVDIMATDLSPSVIDRARAGTYSQFEVQRGMPIQTLLKHFEQVGDKWVVSQELRSMVQFRTLNLLRDFSSLGKFDVVFCRNVLIYFDEQTRLDIMSRIARLMVPESYLVLGAAETVIGFNNLFVTHPEQRGLYQPSGNAAAPMALSRVAG